MKMNIGIDTSTGSAATPPHMRRMMLDMPMNGNTSAAQPMTREHQRGAAEHERHRVAAEDDEEHHDEHDQRQVVDEPGHQT